MDRGNRRSPSAQKSQYFMNEALQQPDQQQQQSAQQRAPAAYHLLYVDRNTAWPLFGSGTSTLVGYVRMMLITGSILQFCIAIGGLVFTNLQEYISIPSILNSAYLIMLATIGMCISVRRNDQSTLIFAMMCIFNAVAVVTILTHNSIQDNKSANICSLPQQAVQYNGARYRTHLRRPPKRGHFVDGKTAPINVIPSGCNCRIVPSECQDNYYISGPVEKCCEFCLDVANDDGQEGNVTGSDDSGEYSGPGEPDLKPRYKSHSRPRSDLSNETGRSTTPPDSMPTTTPASVNLSDKKDYTGIMKALLWSSVALDIVLALLALMLAVCARNDPLVPEPSKTVSTSSGQGPAVLVTTLPATINTRQETRTTVEAAAPSPSPQAPVQHPSEQATYVPSPPTSRKTKSQGHSRPPSPAGKHKKHTSKPSVYGGPPTTVVMARLQPIPPPQPPPLHHHHQQQQHHHHHHHQHQHGHQHQNISHQRLIDHLNKRRRQAVQHQQDSVKKSHRDKKAHSPGGRHKSSMRKRSRQSVYTQVGENRGSKYGNGLAQAAVKSNTSAATAAKSSPKHQSGTKSTISADAVN